MICVVNEIKEWYLSDQQVVIPFQFERHCQPNKIIWMVRAVNGNVFQAWYILSRVCAVHSSTASKPPCIRLSQLLTELPSNSHFWGSTTSLCRSITSSNRSKNRVNFFIADCLWDLPKWPASAWGVRTISVKYPAFAAWKYELHKSFYGRWWDKIRGFSCSER
jgi:hypothetical protein